MAVGALPCYSHVIYGHALYIERVFTIGHITNGFCMVGAIYGPAITMIKNLKG